MINSSTTVNHYPIGKKLLVFIDDMNMPQVDTYGTQQPIALLKLLLEKGGMYDRGKDLNWKNFKDIFFIAAMGKVPNTTMSPAIAMIYTERIYLMLDWFTVKLHVQFWKDYNMHTCTHVPLIHIVVQKLNAEKCYTTVLPGDAYTYSTSTLFLLVFSRLEEVAMKLILGSSPCSLPSMSPFPLMSLSTTFIPQSSRDTSNHSLRVCQLLQYTDIKDLAAMICWQLAHTEEILCLICSCSGSSQTHH